jgi:Raf kinase inhibitor-like YbhB/YbcL family protein
VRLESPAFAAGAAIPAAYTCEGADHSPPLAWSDVPAATQSFTLIVDDPDAPAGVWVHWVLFDLPGSTRALPEGLPPRDTLPELGGARQGRTDFRRIGYGGPCPPPGKPHHYHFTLYALDALLGLPAGATKAEVLRRVPQHLVAQAGLVGTYARRTR